MSIITQIKNGLSQLGIKPKKSLGQNFLVNEGIYKKIVDALAISPTDTIIEVGPGLGTLTQFLAETGAKVIAVEKDHQLAKYLKTKFANEKRVNIVEDDILKFNPLNTKYLIQNTSYKLVGNIPYYLTSHLLRTVLESWPQPKLIVLMLQKEVAQRICASPPHSKLSVGANRQHMSLLAVSVQYYAQPKIISYVSHGNFYPPPEVDSAIIKLESRNQNLESRINSQNFFKIVRAGFAGKRKQLGNNLIRELKLTKDFIEGKLESVNIDPKRRAETLTLEEWQKITNIFYVQD